MKGVVTFISAVRRSGFLDSRWPGIQQVPVHQGLSWAVDKCIRLLSRRHLESRPTGGADDF